MSRSFKYGKKVWKPKNYEKNFEGLISLRDALVHSRNLATINLVRELGLNSVYKSLTNMGFEGLQKDLSISLGTFGISPLNFAGKYTIFSNYGTMVKPKLTKKLVDKDGKVRILEPIEYQITEPKQAFLTITILEDVVKRGTATRAKVEGIETAGKTGTTNEYKDAWFCGFTPEITVITWFGKDNNKPMYKETGGKAAGPSFANFVKGYLKLHPETKRKFDIPEGVRVVKINGKDEYFTDISQPPNNSVESDSEVGEEELLF
jgi:penicillin-binding protein 1A